MSPSVTLHGHVAPGFEPVREAFLTNFEEGEIGAQVCIHHRGEVVVDLTAGMADKDTERPWTDDTICAIYSATKGVVALVFLMLTDRGLVDPDAKVTEYWPEFGANGKQDITVRMCLNHRAGLHALDTKLEIAEAADPAKAEAAIVAQTPGWAPGSDQGYGANIWGILMAAIFRKLTQRDLGSFIAEELAGPLGLDMHLGLALEEHHRAAALYGSSISTALRRFGPRMLRGRTTEGRLYRSVLFNRGSESYKALLNPDPGPRRLECLNEPENRTMQLPWMNMHTNGPSLSRLYAVLAEGGELDGVRLMDAATIAPLHHAQSWSDMDRVLQKPLGFSQGFQKEELTLFSPEGSWMGHSGMGGSLGFADPHHRMSFAYVQNALSPYIRSPRCVRLCRAAYKSLGVL